MANPIDIGLRIAQALDSIGIKMGSYIGKGSNVKKAMFGGKSTMFKPNAIQSLRGEGKNFEDALKLIEEESQFIVNATDAEKMAYLNNLNDYKDLGGPLKKDLVASKQFEEGIGSLKDDIESLQSTAKTMKEDAEKGLKSAEDDLKTFLETGGNPLKKEDKKYLGGSMHEEGQLRTAIRTFLKNEFKNGKIKLDKDDQFRIMEYSPMMEDDPIKVFKKIYGDEAYKRAGTFPGAFETGENFNHYESIFRSKMGEDILKVKDKKYVGDGTLVLTDEIKTPTPDDDVPFAKGGRASFASGGGKKRIVQEILEYITTKFTPMDAMKEINKVVGKTGKYKNLKLTDDDINDIVEGSNDFIFQRDPDNLFVEDRPMFKKETDEVDPDSELGKSIRMEAEAEKKLKKLNMSDKEIALRGDYPYDTDAQIKARLDEMNVTKNAQAALKKIKEKSVDNMSLEESLTTLEGLGGTKMAERFRLKQKYPGLDDDLLTNIIEDTDPVHKASVLAKIDMAMELGKTNKSADEIIDILKKEPETKMATGGRAGYYGGGMTNMIEPDLSDIGHGSDALMARTRLTAPGSQATTSTGLNYLLGEDNDNIRVPFGGGGTMGASDRGYQGGGRNAQGSVSGTAPGAAPVGGGPDDRGSPTQNLNNYLAINAPPKQKQSMIDSIKNNRFLNNPFTRGALRVGAYTYNPTLLGTDLRSIMQAKDIYDKATNFTKEDMTLGIVSEQQQKEIDTAANAANLMNDKGVLTDIEKTQIYNDVKPFDDKGSSGIFGIGATEASPMTKSEFDTYVKDKGYADGGIAGLRKGYVGGGGVNLGRRGFLKILAGTGAAITAFKTGALKLLGKSTTKAAPKLFTAAEGSGAPAWFEGMVNKVLADGVDITKKAATMDGQTVKSLDTPTGKVDVTIDRTGNIDVNYMGENTAMGEGVDMRYVVGQADETTKVKPFDEFEAVESIPEGQMYGPDDYQVEMGENATGEVKNLYSDVSELQTLGGDKRLINDISVTLQKKKTLKQMNENPDEFASDNLPDYDPT